MALQPRATLVSKPVLETGQGGRREGLGLTLCPATLLGLVQYALTHGQPANSVLDGILPLHAACSGGSELVVKLLLDFGADVNAPRFVYGPSPLVIGPSAGLLQRSRLPLIYSPLPCTYRLPRRYTDRKTEGGTIIGSSGTVVLHSSFRSLRLVRTSIYLPRGIDENSSLTTSVFVL